MRLKLWNKIPETVKNGTPKEKWYYFWEYYKAHAIVAAFLVIFVISYIYNALTAKDILLNGFFLNSISGKSAVEELKYDFLEKEAIDTAKYDVIFDADRIYSLDLSSSDYSYNYKTSQALVTQTSAGDLDFVAGDLPVMTVTAYSEYFLDLSKVLSQEQLELYEPYFLYIDQPVLEQLMETKSSENEEMITIPDCRQPETMEKPVPVMIDVSSWDKVEKIYDGGEETRIAIGCIINSSNIETVLAFIDYLYER